MGSIIEQSFENSTLANLSKAFEATWKVLHTRNPPCDADAEVDLRLALSGKLLELAANGVTDPKELQNRVLQSLDGNGPTGARKTLAERLRFRSQ
jgi:hypothetical protein